MHRLREAHWSLGLLLLTCILGFGVQLRQLGFYWDDYASMYVFTDKGSEVFVEWADGQARPLIGQLLVPIWEHVGLEAVGWHLINFGLYVASVLLFWGILRLLWPDYPAHTTLTAMLFAVYPSYHLRPIPISINLTVGLDVFLLSFWLSLVAVKRRSWPLILISALLIPVSMTIYEQNIAYEALRPLAMLWLLTGRQPLHWQAYLPHFTGRQPHLRRAYLPHLRRLVVWWWPYTAMTLLAIVWRFVLHQPNETYASYNQPIYLDSLSGWALMLKLSIGAPLKMLVVDWVYMPWRLFISEGVDTDVPGLLTALLLPFLLLYLWRYYRPRQQGPKVVLFISFGMMGVLLFSAHMVGRVLDVGFDSRWSLTPSLMAAIILGFGLPRLWRQGGELLLVALVVVGMGVQTAVNQLYADDWAFRRDLWWQLSWRAPEIEPGTMVIFVFADGASGLAFDRPINDYEMVGHTNLYYDAETYPVVVGGDIADIQSLLTRPDGFTRQGVWSQIISGRDVIFRDWAVDFDKVLVFGYEGGCLRTADATAQTQTMPNTLFTTLARLHNPAQIAATPFEAVDTHHDLIQPEPAHEWCFYYQQIQWALEHDQLETAVRLADEVRSVGYQPKFQQEIEWLPVIEAYARAGREADAAAVMNALSLSSAHDRQAACERLTQCFALPAAG